MKPLYLKMKAFGPFKDEIEIDFNEIGSNGLFLITGDTGAGKTTIFDAIAFALYNTASGSNRSIVSLKSDFADDNTDSFVEFKFSHKGKIYNIKRNPTYTKQKKNGNGLKNVLADAKLEYDDIVVAGTNDVTRKIEEILGINAKQFKQIAILPQGEFLKILYSESSERTEIFRRIFDTDLYKKISDRLYNKTTDTKKEIDSLKTEFITYVDTIRWHEEIPNETEDYFYQNGIEELLDKIKDDNTKTSALLNEKEGKLKELENSEKQLDKKIDAQKETNAIFDKYDNYVSQKENLEKKKNEIEEYKNTLEINKKIKLDAVPIEEKIKELEKEKKSLEKLQKETNTKLEECKEKELKIEKALKDEEGTKRLIDSYNKENELINEVISKIAKITDINKKLLTKNELANKKEVLKENFEIAAKKYLDEENKFFNEQVGIIAKTIKENKPCPVCGSIEHPNIAHVSQAVLTKEEIELLKQKKENAENEYRIIKDEIIKNNVLIEQYLKDFGEDISIDNLNETASFYEQKRKDLLSNLKKYKDDFKEITGSSDIDNFNVDDYFKNIHNSITEIVKEKSSLETKEKSYEEQQKEVEKQSKTLNEKMEEFFKSIGISSYNEYERIKIDSKKEKELEKEVEEYKEKYSASVVRIEEIKKSMDNKTRTSTKELEDEKIKINILKSPLQRDIESLKVDVEINKNSYQKIKNMKKTILDKLEEVAIIEELSKTANGTLAGKRKISFEQYVQATYFKIIINEANKRFEKMTDGRYIMIRKENSDKISDKIGLELEIIDNYTGKKRDIKSLSGGEAFKASLSLSLGLSDVIQSYSGGVRLDTLFIDEGFGSLDNESRMQAINTLFMLSQNDKLIGIISHVSELKELIDKKIIVKKSSSGSKIEIN